MSETDGHVFRVDERWTSKRTMFKCAKLVPLEGKVQKAFTGVFGSKRVMLKCTCLSSHASKSS